MRSRARPPLGRVITGLAVLALLTGSAGASTTDPDAPVRPLPRMVVSGHVRGLFPGASMRMPATVRNLHAVDLRLTRLDATVTSPRSACPAGALRVLAPRSLPLVPALGSVRVWLRVRLRPRASDPCQGARFLLAFETEAVPA